MHAAIEALYGAPWPPAPVEAVEAAVATLSPTEMAETLEEVFAQGYAAHASHANVARVLARELAASGDGEATGRLGVLLDGGGDVLLRMTAAEGALDGAAGPAVLDGLAAHLDPVDPLFRAAVRARARRGDADLLETVGAALAGSPAPAFLVEKLPFDDLPLTAAWLDLAHPHLESVGHLLVGPLVERGAPEAVLHLLERGVSRALAVDLLPVLQARGRPADAPRLREVARDARYRGMIARLAKEVAAALEAGAPAPAVPRVEGSIATDGGPVLLAPEAALRAWEGTVTADYDEAGAFTGVGFLRRGGAAILVAASEGAWVTRDMQALDVVLSGTPELMGLIGGALRHRALDTALEAPDGRLWLHDAACAGAERADAVKLDVPAGTLRVSEARIDDERGLLWVLRLQPAGR